MSGEGSELTTMDIHQILKLLPHRYPFLLVDRVKELVADSHIVALKNVSMNEPFFPGHYPHHPVMPGVLIIEALAQTCALLSYRSMGAGTDDNSVYYFVGIDNARFKRPVSPGDQMVMEAKLDGNKRGLWKFTTVAKVDGLVVAEAQIICTVRAIEK